LRRTSGPYRIHEDRFDLRRVDRFLNDLDVGRASFILEHFWCIKAIVLDPKDDNVEAEDSASVLPLVPVTGLNHRDQVLELQLLRHVLRVDDQCFVTTLAHAVLAPRHRQRILYLLDNLVDNSDFVALDTQSLFQQLFLSGVHEEHIGTIASP